MQNVLEVTIDAELPMDHSGERYGAVVRFCYPAECGNEYLCTSVKVSTPLARLLSCSYRLSLLWAESSCKGHQCRHHGRV